MYKSRKQLLEENLELQEQVKTLMWDSAYNCYSRAGIEYIVWPKICDSIEAIISFDIDDMHGLNTQHGHAEMDARIRKSLHLRKSDFVHIARIKSGDECAIFVSKTPGRQPTDLEAMRKRIEESFAENGMMITAAIYRTHGNDFHKNIKAAFRLVEDLKRGRKLKGRR